MNLLIIKILPGKCGKLSSTNFQKYIHKNDLDTNKQRYLVEKINRASKPYVLIV